MGGMVHRTLYGTLGTSFAALLCLHVFLAKLVRGPSAPCGQSRTDDHGLVDSKLLLTLYCGWVFKREVSSETPFAKVPPHDKAEPGPSTDQEHRSTSRVHVQFVVVGVGILHRLRYGSINNSTL